jgi:hypothetical protein
VPIKDKPLPKFLDDAANGKFLAAARQLTDEFGRLAIEIWGSPAAADSWSRLLG